MNYKIALIKGDGIGPEVVGEAVKVMEAIGEKFGHKFDFTEVLMGGCATDTVGVSYPAKQRHRPYRPPQCLRGRTRQQYRWHSRP